MQYPQPISEIKLQPYLRRPRDGWWRHECDRCRRHYIYSSPAPLLWWPAIPYMFGILSGAAIAYWLASRNGPVSNVALFALVVGSWAVPLYFGLLWRRETINRHTPGTPLDVSWNDGRLHYHVTDPGALPWLPVCLCIQGCLHSLAVYQLAKGDYDWYYPLTDTRLHFIAFISLACCLYLLSLPSWERLPDPPSTSSQDDSQTFKDV